MTILLYAAHINGLSISVTPTRRTYFKTCLCLSTLFFFFFFLKSSIWHFSWHLLSRYPKRTWWRLWRNWCSMLTKQKELPIETNSSPRSSTSAARATTSTSPTLSGQSPQSSAISRSPLLFKDLTFIFPPVVFLTGISASWWSWRGWRAPGTVISSPLRCSM